MAPASSTPPSAKAPVAPSSPLKESTTAAPVEPVDAASAPPAPVAVSEAKPSAAAAAASAEDDDKTIGAEPSGEVIDMEVFGQLLEIDDDDTHEFSKTLAFDYISQADTTFGEIDEALIARDLDTLSRKGHFLKGSSAALGLQRVQRSCELMQHFGNRRDDKGEGPELSEDAALKKCTSLLVRLRREQQEAKEWLMAYYKD